LIVHLLRQQHIIFRCAAAKKSEFGRYVASEVRIFLLASLRSRRASFILM